MSVYCLTILLYGRPSDSRMTWENLQALLPSKWHLSGGIQTHDNWTITIQNETFTTGYVNIRRVQPFLTEADEHKGNV